MVRSVHLAMVENGVRDKASLIAGGGIALPEHFVKLTACGIDIVVIDEPLLIALECRMCNECETTRQCPMHLESVPEDWGRQRIVNMLGSWHSQIVEMLGAMGLREVRRLRGDTGRIMFFKDLERECFGPIFGNRR